MLRPSSRVGRGFLPASLIGEIGLYLARRPTTDDGDDDDDVVARCNGRLTGVGELRNRNGPSPVLINKC